MSKNKVEAAMKLGLFLVLSSQVLPMIDCQTLGAKLGPLLKLTRPFMSDVIRPRTFEVGYQISRKNNVWWMTTV